MLPLPFLELVVVLQVPHSQTRRPRSWEAIVPSISLLALESLQTLKLWVESRTLGALLLQSWKPGSSGLGSQVL